LNADWSGSSYTAAARATYPMPLGWFDVKPYAGIDYIGFTQDGYQETAVTNDGLTIIAGDADASLATGSLGLQLIGNFGSDDAFTIRPSLSVGYRSILSWKETPATLRFEGGSPTSTFDLIPGLEPEDAITAGLGLNVNSQFVNIKLGYDAQISDMSTTHYGSITFRMAFW
jgi:outer membrane autotransporter protein